MALTTDEKAAVRDYMGYAAIDTGVLFQAREMAYSDVTFLGVSLEALDTTVSVLDNLSTYAETRIRTYFLPALRSREAEIQTAAGNLDTQQASVWKHNPNEVADRASLFRQLRLDLCAFLGFPPGSALARTNRLVRA